MILESARFDLSLSSSVVIAVESPPGATGLIILIFSDIGRIFSSSSIAMKLSKDFSERMNLSLNLGSICYNIMEIPGIVLPFAKEYGSACAYPSLEYTITSRKSSF